MKYTITVFLFLALGIVSCGPVDANKQIDEGKVNGKKYESKEIGWTIIIPDGFEVVSRDIIEANDAKGKAAIENATGQELDTRGLKHLISFQKDRFNLFASTSEPFVEYFPGEYQQNTIALNALMFDTFKEQGIKTDTSSGIEIIQELEFNKFNTTIYGPDGKVILYQILYSRLINGYDFGVNINYNNERDKKIMVDAFLNSEFAAD